VRCVYVDLDGTLLGRGASLFRDADGAFTLLGARALEACARTRTEVVPVSGRGRRALFEATRLLGLDSYVAELGSIVTLDGESEFLTDPYQPTETATVHHQITEAGAPALLLERYAGRLEPHDPWTHGREVTHLLRGLVDGEEATALLAEHGHEHLRLIDNGLVHRRSAALDGLPEVHAYHLLPRMASKAHGVARHMQMRGFDPADCIAVGDSVEDTGLARVVDTLWIVANGLERPGLREALAEHANVRVAEASNGAGVYEAVVTELAERR